MRIWLNWLHERFILISMCTVQLTTQRWKREWEEKRNNRMDNTSCGLLFSVIKFKLKYTTSLISSKMTIYKMVTNYCFCCSRFDFLFFYILLHSALLKFDDVDMMDVSDDDRIGQLNKRGMNLVLIVPYPLFINLVVLKEEKKLFFS